MTSTQIVSLFNYDQSPISQQHCTESIWQLTHHLCGSDRMKGQIMHASYVELKVKPDQFEAMKNYTDSIEEKIKAVGMNQFLVLDRGDNTCLLIVIYNSAAEQEAAAPIAAEVLGEYTQKFLSEPPERKQVEVLFNY